MQGQIQILGGDFNANTREGMTQYLFTVPAEDAADVRELLRGEARAFRARRTPKNT